MDAKTALRFAASIVSCELAGAIGSIATVPNIPAWYATLDKPSFSPPNWVFFPVWTTLYALMGGSLAIILGMDIKVKGVKLALGLFVVQLYLNVLWSFAFFGGHSPWAGVTVILLLWLSIALTIAVFSKLSKTAAWLMVPYILWVSFAALLNVAIALAN